jgi:hypothetical protein
MGESCRSLCSRKQLVDTSMPEESTYKELKKVQNDEGFFELGANWVRGRARESA